MNDKKMNDKKMNDKNQEKHLRIKRTVVTTSLMFAIMGAISSVAGFIERFSGKDASLFSQMWSIFLLVSITTFIIYDILDK